MIVKINGTSVLQDTLYEVMHTPGTFEFFLVTAVAVTSAAVNHYLAVKGGKRDKYKWVRIVLDKTLWIGAGILFINLFLRNSQSIAAMFDLHIR